MAGTEINMVMVGPSRVGKSSLLTTMYREIGKLKAGFNLTPDATTSDTLDEAFQNLNRVMERLKFAPVEDLLAATKGFLEHRFDVSFHGVKEFDLVFHDFRGGAMKRRADPEWEQLEERVASSHVVFNVLDAVALMETDEIRSDELNGHTRVKELLERTMTAGKKYLIVFVPVKCEAYVKTAGGRDRLVRRFEERHAGVLRLIERLNQANGNVAALLIPAVTLGCVEFKEIDPEGNFVFVRNHQDFAPRDVDQPLRYALSFALSRVHEDRDLWTWFINFLTGRGQAFGQALNDFCKGRKDEYKTYGNEALLR
jgi:hypothetical protein